MTNDEMKILVKSMMGFDWDVDSLLLIAIGKERAAHFRLGGRIDEQIYHLERFKMDLMDEAKKIENMQKTKHNSDIIVSSTPE